MKNPFYKVKDESYIEFMKTKKKCFAGSISDSNIASILGEIKSYIERFDYNNRTYSLLKNFF